MCPEAAHGCGEAKWDSGSFVKSDVVWDLVQGEIGCGSHSEFDLTFHLGRIVYDSQTVFLEGRVRGFEPAGEETRSDRRWM